MGAFDLFFGTALIGTWGASILLGLCFAQAAHYFNTFPNDSWKRKSLVLSTLLFSVLGFIGGCADAYAPLVTHWGDIERAADVTWGVSVSQISYAVVGAMVNSYLISRYYNLSKNKIVTLVLLGLVLETASPFPLRILIDIDTASPTVGARTASIELERDVAQAEKLGTIFAISSAVSDVLIAAALVWVLRSMRPSFKSTKRLIQRVMTTSIQCGAATSLAAIGGMFSMIFKIQSSLATLFLFLLGPLYTLTLLANFNMRDNGSSGTSVATTTTPTSIVLDGIYVHRTTVNDAEFPEARRQESRGRVNPKYDSYPLSEVKSDLGTPDVERVD
ncbi:hypothetical protein C8R47DRAFT_1210909 [Mycena vitilis]|nr:hypothetical protein C8R47DRAFT_1210909 [Mycena vitilis]